MRILLLVSTSRSLAPRPQSSRPMMGRCVSHTIDRNYLSTRHLWLQISDAQINAAFGRGYGQSFAETNKTTMEKRYLGLQVFGWSCYIIITAGEYNYNSCIDFVFIFVCVRCCCDIRKCHRKLSSGQSWRGRTNCVFKKKRTLAVYQFENKRSKTSSLLKWTQQSCYNEVGCVLGSAHSFYGIVLVDLTSRFKN